MKRTSKKSRGRGLFSLVRGKKRDRFLVVALVAAFIALAMGVWVLLESETKAQAVEKQAAAEKTPAPSSERLPPKEPAALSPKKEAQVKTPEATKTPAPVRKPVAVAVVIDDAGNDITELKPFLKFPGALTIAVLPGLPHSKEAARLVREAGKELFLHQPMESLGKLNPGPGAIYEGMSADAARKVLNANLDELWPVAGLNNHEGSRVTEDESLMEAVLSVCKTRGIAFLDSRTTAQTKAPEAAARLGFHIAERNVFLDNESDPVSIAAYFDKGLGEAKERGSCIMIGHVKSAALAALLDTRYKVGDRSWTFTTVTDLLYSKMK
jgi:polysaccharide deacetylase 2 family uncharacterized protein YibQ